jgi:hypothetical protein
MKGDITIYDEGLGFPGDDVFPVASGTCAQKIKEGEPVLATLGGTGRAATALATNLPSSAALANTITGIATTTSTDTVAAAGTVRVMKYDPCLTFLIAPNVVATWDTQAEYDALVGHRVLLDLTGTAALGTATYTILAADNAAYGCVIEPLDIKKYPGKVRFSIRPAATTKGWATGIS